MRGIILPTGVSAEEFLETLRKDILALLEKEPSLKKLNGSDLKNYILGIVNKHFQDTMKFQPLVQVLLQEVSVKGAGSLKSQGKRS
jgi:hypothetical protein